ncbi:FAD-binding protein [Sediminispirochaeta bajacaliforniensis]|uniref:FAD-binding protein n=1 Tax=Sediminispirochaeta bajacaliforniensis TaxID=148 RepID=UPI0003739916|nr:FAD-binding protein [Sediminispirochaeta bajacaliforniensis]
MKFVYPNIWGEEAYATYHLVYPYGPSRFAPVVDDIQKHGGTILLETEGTAFTKELFVEVAEIGMTPGVPENPKWNLDLMSVAGLLHVNTNGIRYFNEGLFKEEPLNIGGASVGNGGPYFVVFDQKTYDTVIREGLIELIPDSEKTKWEKQHERLSQYGATSGVPPMFAGIAHPLDNLEAEMGQAYDMGIAWKADTIEALADKMGLPNLVSTVERYQELVKQGRDEDLYKNSIFLTDISTEPFYAISFLPAGFNTSGGVKVNENLEALTNDNVPIRGLYVAGVDGGSMFHKPYYDICGTSMMYAIGSGRIEGREAAKYVVSK